MKSQKKYIFLQMTGEIMAQIKQFVPKTDNSEPRGDFEEKIRKHRRSRLAKAALVTLATVVVVLALTAYSRNQIYRSYTQIATADRTIVSESTCLNHNGNLLIYSRDGISSMDAKGNVLWNETYQMQRPIVRINGSAVAAGDYNGNVIYIMDENGKIGEIDTNLPIQDFCISKTGIVAAILADSQVMRLNVYNTNGEEAVKSESRMNQKGYPLAAALSDDGKVMAVSYLYVDSGTMRTSVAFYNFSEVGQNSVDRFISGYDYMDTVMPTVGFLGTNAAYAIGDGRISFFSGEEKPVSIAENLLNEQIQSIYTGERHVALVFVDSTGASGYRVDVYDETGTVVLSQKIDIEYQNILIREDSILIYNEKECLMYGMNGKQKYKGSFAKNVSLVIPGQRSNRLVLVTADSIDTVELN